MAEQKEEPKKVASWRLHADIILMLEAIAKDEGESQATILRTWIKEDFKRRGLTLPKKKR